MKAKEIAEAALKAAEAASEDGDSTDADSSLESKIEWQPSPMYEPILKKLKSYLGGSYYKPSMWEGFKFKAM